MWLTERLAPDFKTIADFRKNNGEAIGRACREFVSLCGKLGLFQHAFVAIDGSKFKAVNNRDKNFTKAKMKRFLKRVDDSIARYLAEIESADRLEPDVAEPRVRRLSDKIAALKKEMARLKELESQMLASPDEQLSLTDPDARSMNCRGDGVVGYNVQSAVDVETHLIVAHEVTNIGSDRAQLSNMAGEAKAALGVDTLEAVADRGYYKGEELQACEDLNVTTFVPKSQTSGNQARGFFGKRDFIYKPEDDEYECPAGERAIFRSAREEGGQIIRRYWSSACPTCPLKPQCTSGKERRISRTEYEEACERAQARLDAEPERVRIRREVAEHPFGTLKASMGATHFQMKTLPKVKTEMALQVLAYNIKRVISMLGVTGLVAAMTTA